MIDARCAVKFWKRLCRYISLFWLITFGLTFGSCQHSCPHILSISAVNHIKKLMQRFYRDLFRSMCFSNSQIHKSGKNHRRNPLFYQEPGISPCLVLDTPDLRCCCFPQASELELMLPAGDQVPGETLAAPSAKITALLNVLRAEHSSMHLLNEVKLKPVALFESKSHTRLDCAANKYPNRTTPLMHVVEL